MELEVPTIDHKDQQSESDHQQPAANATTNGDAVLQVTLGKKDEADASDHELRRQHASEHIFTLPPHRRVQLAFRNVRYSVPSKKESQPKQILRGVNGVVQPGELLGVMGPSGCGKTTLLDFLADRIGSGQREGDVLINGEPRKSRTFRHLARYVPQEDHLTGSMTVLETLQFSAEVSLPQSMPAAAKQERVRAALDQLGLTDSAHAAVGTVFTKGISGGQKRRLSMGVELIAQPRLLFLDEPTSGLDSAAAAAVLSVLKKLTQLGHTVVCTIHQPSSEIFHMLDKVMLLSRGRTVYFGPTHSVVDYFAALGKPCPQYTNPADFVMQIINSDFEGVVDGAELDRQKEQQQKTRQEVGKDGSSVQIDVAPPSNNNNNNGKVAPLPSRADRIQEIEELADKFEQSQLYQVLMASQAQAPEADSKKASRGGADADADVERDEFQVSFAKQFWELSKRAWLDNLRNPGIFWVRLVMYLMLSLMIGTMYLGIGSGQDSVNDRVSILFYVAAFMVFMSIAVIPAFIAERAVFVRERANGWYHVGAYVLANMVCGIPGIFMIALVSSVTIYFMVGLNSDEGRFGIFLLDLFLSLLCAESLMLIISAIVPIYIVGMALGAGIFGMFMLCEGFFVIRDNIPPYWIWGYYIGFHTYSFEMFMHNEFDGASLKCDAPVGNTGLCRFNTGEDVLSLYGMDSVRIWVDVVVLIAMMLIYRLIFFFILQVFHKGKR